MWGEGGGRAKMAQDRSMHADALMPIVLGHRISSDVVVSQQLFLTVSSC